MAIDPPLLSPFIPNACLLLDVRQPEGNWGEVF